MMRLYRKNEVLFAVLWIVVYVIVCGNLRTLGDDSPAMAVGLTAIAAAAALFVIKNGLTEKYGLSGWSQNSRQMLWFIPLWIISSGNLWGGIAPHYQGVGLVCAVISFVLVGFVEELLFRGFLFKAMLGNGSEKAAIIVSSVTFGMGHIVNLLTGHGTIETLLQMVFAVAVGFVLTLALYKGGSLWPCIIAHSLIDMFSVVSARSEFMDYVYIVVALVISVAYCAYLVRLQTPTIRQEHPSSL